MDKGISTHDLLRLIGVMAIGVGAAWVLQVVGLGDSTALGRLTWVVASAAVAGVGAGLIFTATTLGTSGSAKA